MASLAENEQAAALQQQLDEERARRFHVERSNLKLQEQKIQLEEKRLVLEEEAFQRDKAARQTEARQHTSSRLPKPVEAPRRHASDIFAAAAGA